MSNNLTLLQRADQNFDMGSITLQNLWDDYKYTWSCLVIHHLHNIPKGTHYHYYNTLITLTSPLQRLILISQKTHLYGLLFVWFELYSLESSNPFCISESNWSVSADCSKLVLVCQRDTFLSPREMDIIGLAGQDCQEFAPERSIWKKFILLYDTHCSLEALASAFITSTFINALKTNCQRLTKPG